MENGGEKVELRECWVGRYLRGGGGGTGVGGIRTEGGTAWGGFSDIISGVVVGYEAC